MNQTTHVRLNQSDIIEAVGLLLRKRSEVDGYGYLRFKFGIVGDPQIMLIGDACEMPDAGDVYVDVSFEPLPNVESINAKK